MRSFLAIAALLFAAQGPDTTPPAPFTAARFREHVAYLASDELAGRAVGSVGSAKALDYLRRHLKEYGTKGLGPGDAWFQTFPCERGAVSGRNLLAVVPGQGELA